MSLLNEITFERLLPRYERTFGELPPFSSANVEDVVTFMRDRLQFCEKVEADGDSKSMAATHAVIAPKRQPSSVHASR